MPENVFINSRGEWRCVDEHTPKPPPVLRSWQLLKAPFHQSPMQYLTNASFLSFVVNITIRHSLRIHKHTHKHTEQSRAIAFLHLSLRSLIVSVHVCSEVLFLPRPLLIVLSSPFCLWSFETEIKGLSWAATWMLTPQPIPPTLRCQSEI